MTRVGKKRANVIGHLMNFADKACLNITCAFYLMWPPMVDHPAEANLCNDDLHLWHLEDLSITLCFCTVIIVFVLGALVL